MTFRLHVDAWVWSICAGAAVVEHKVDKRN